MVRALAEELQKDIEAAEPSLLQAFFESTNPGNTRNTSELGTPYHLDSAAKGASGKPFGTLIDQTQSAVCGLQRAMLREFREKTVLPTGEGLPHVAELSEQSAPRTLQLAWKSSSVPIVPLSSDCTASSANAACTGRSTSSVAAVASANERVTVAEERAAATGGDTTSDSLLLQKLLALQPETSIVTTAAATPNETGSVNRMDQRAVAMVDAAVAAAVTAEMRKRPTGVGTRLIYSRSSFEVLLLDIYAGPGS